MIVETLTQPPQKPENIEAQRVYDEMLALAKELPTPTTNSRKSHEKFHNNFYLLFRAIGDQKSNTASSPMVKIYLDKAEALGAKWQQFITENNKLIEDILEALKGAEKYDRLSALNAQLSSFGSSASPKLARKVRENINLQAIGVDVWNKINPLLKQASEAMTKYHIHPETFYS